MTRPYIVPCVKEINEIPMVTASVHARLAEGPCTAAETRELPAYQSHVRYVGRHGGVLFCLVFTTRAIASRSAVDANKKKLRTIHQHRCRSLCTLFAVIVPWLNINLKSRLRVDFSQSRQGEWNLSIATILDTVKNLMVKSCWKLSTQHMKRKSLCCRLSRRRR